MNKRIVFILGFTTLLLGGQVSSPIQRSSLQQEIAQLARQGISVRFLPQKERFPDNSTVEVSDPASGLKRIKTLHEPGEAAIRSWAAARDVPILEIDPSTLDTSRWSGWFRYWTTLPLSNGFGNPLVVGDLDSNGKPEVYGIYKSYTSDFESHIYEVDSSGSYFLLYNYIPRLGPSRFFTDIDGNSLREIEFAYGSAEYIFEQPAPRFLPTVFKTRVIRDTVYGSVFTGVFFGDLDGNRITEFVNTGGIPDSATGNPLRKVFVREYDSPQNAFITVWSTLFDQPLGNYGGFTAGDFDGDGKQEFQCVEIMGKVYVVESQGIHSYATTWSDSTPFVNLFYQTLGDIDRDGKQEFYVGATMSNGNWTTMYEADSNDHYSPRFVFHLLSGGSLDEPTYLTPDVDQDGKPEFLILSGADLYIFKSDGNDSFFLWYYRRFNAKESIQFYDFDHDGKQDFVLSRARQDSLIRLAHFADIYLAERFTGVKQSGPAKPSSFSLVQNYPNPFNSSTNISYHLDERTDVTLEVVDLGGKVLQRLVHGTQGLGRYEVKWNGKNERGEEVSSGIYICRLAGKRFSKAIKMVLLR